LSTGFYSDERTFWHSTGVQALIMPIGGWVQPPSGSYGADTPDSKRRFYNLAKASGILKNLVCPDAIPASRTDMLRVHTERYIDLFKDVSDAGGGELGPSAPFGKGGFEIAALSAGLAIEAVKDVIAGEVDKAYALCRPAGHHCMPDHAMGLCLLANIPIAIEAARAQFGALRAAVVDWDVHHGNGTQHVYYDRGDTLTISLHQDRCFPTGYGGIEDRGSGNGEGCNLNIPLPPGSGHETYLSAIDTIVVPALERFNPDLIVIASGLDASGLDPLGRMMLHSGSYREMTARMVAVADRLCNGRLVVVHEGGYSEYYVPFCGQAILETLSGRSTAVEAPDMEMHLGWQPSPRVVAFHAELIHEMAVEFGLAIQDK